jgi:transcriptional regulator GlxA family with amidase domain
MQIAVLTFEGYNELDSFVVAALLNRAGLNAYITTPAARVKSMFGVEVQGQKPLAFASEADAVVFGSGPGTRKVVKDPSLLAQIKLDPSRQMIASQCSGALILAALGLVAPGETVCTDLTTAPRAREAGLVVSDKPFLVRGNIATAGGCLASQYIAAWIVGRALGPQAARDVIWYAAPVGEKDDYADRAMAAAGVLETLTA